MMNSSFSAQYLTKSIALVAVVTLLGARQLSASTINFVDIYAPNAAMSYTAATGAYSAGDSSDYAHWTMQSYPGMQPLITVGGFTSGSSFLLNATFDTNVSHEVNGLMLASAGNFTFSGVTTGSAQTTYGSFGTAGTDTLFLHGTLAPTTKVADLFFRSQGTLEGSNGIIEVFVAPTMYNASTGTGIAQTDIIVTPAPAAWGGGGLLMLGVLCLRVRGWFARSAAC
jgi:hypothetical protein